MIELLMDTCEDCGNEFPSEDMHHDESGAYCEADHDRYMAEQMRLYAPRGAVQRPVEPVDESLAYEWGNYKNIDYLESIF